MLGIVGITLAVTMFPLFIVLVALYAAAIVIGILV